ncbi:MAG TPA: gliding motility-associated ABC transporter ATP-binding subunit GldA [Bacteroidales bacterium]|nr:MAG: gliding motility-associated ABC transporter ATP-binding subunit GldA [Bacteroidetes bacterium GWF2_33_38]OFY76696.1 MAG: gliding motility-associated ABC transporter ATP-binding subunit GldA [Bacteroidetes bacterium RIFOXYA12_FULL_33_9]OFY84869.1 MAG: gliding motility-associated ABC transporter ATP-binding subunit GldA [Bacteroidetes bacterium RIFOXYA2_FULL_33_7]HBF87527.1 gliding motility-associated ABC transporter ATP-binding subunit GldA [Bacteroidales bacterium]
MSIEVKNITKIYGTQKALNNVSFKINTGEIVGFLGPNGAGKSTMMKIITGFIPPSQGEVFVNELDVVENSLEVREMIGYLPENNPLYHEMYVKEYLNYVAGIYKLGKQTKSRIDDIIDITGLAIEQKKKIGELSKGYRQRVGLAQALIHDPNVLILDEPTSGLDPNQIIEIRNLITKIGKEKTVMLSTHIMQEVEAICDRTIIIKNGVIVADDTTKNIHKYTDDKFQTIIVEFDKKIDFQLLEKLEGVVKVKNIDEQNWLIQTEDNIDVRPKIFDLAVRQKITVLSMQKREKRLEDVFHELTK